jgi:hypothetical protein
MNKLEVQIRAARKLGLPPDDVNVINFDKDMAIVQVTYVIPPLAQYQSDTRPPRTVNEKSMQTIGVLLCR